MSHDLLKSLPGLDTLSEEEANAIRSQLSVASYKKGTVLLKAGEISGMCYFILKGCVRQYVMVDGEEKTTAFFTEQQAAVPFTSYTKQEPSAYYFICAEDCTLVEGDIKKEQDMYRRFPKLLAITRAVMEQDLGKTQEAFSLFITSSPEERYLNLLRTRPELLQRVPLHQVASYLGMTPESLSRIRKRTSRHS